MESLNLLLYPTLESRPKVTSTFKPDPLPQQPNYANPLTSLESTLNSILPPQVEETNVVRTRKLLGETAQALSDEQLECIVTEFQFLINSWLDEYEKGVFNNMTLKEVLHEG